MEVANQLLTQSLTLDHSILQSFVVSEQYYVLLLIISFVSGNQTSMETESHMHTQTV